MFSTRHNIDITEFYQDTRMGNCYKLYTGDELIGIFPSEVAINLMVDMLVACIPVTTAKCNFRYCISYIPDFK